MSDRPAVEEAEIDRIAPTRRPDRTPSGYHRWRKLLFLHWPVPVDVLRPLVPERLSIDTFEGQAYIGVIPFEIDMLRTRLMPEAFALRFLETNCRTYVHVDGRDPGVFFFSLDAASRLAVWGARMTVGLPYFLADIKLEEREDDIFEYTLQRLEGARPSLHVEYRVGEALPPAAPGTLEHFLVERYFLHDEKGGTVSSLQVHHPPYPLERARILDLQDDLVAAAGLPRPEGPPPLVHWSWGVDVEVFAPVTR